MSTTKRLEALARWDQQEYNVKLKLIYVAGPYRGDSKEEVELNIQSAKQVGKLCADKGWYPIIPHLNTAGFEILCPKLTDDFWLEGTLEAARRCDAMVLCPGWEFSTGSRGEQLEAIRLKIQIYLNVTEVPNAWHDVCMP